MDLLMTSVLSRESCGAPYTLVVLKGEADATNSEQLRELFESEIAAGLRTLIVELSALAFMDSTALRVLLQCRRMLDGQGGVLGLVQPQGSVARMLRVTRADQLVPVYDSVEQAAAG
jgi:anti-anti-sigma factor